MMKCYCVVYMVCGTHYRYRCSAENKRDARKMCREYMGVSNSKIVSVEEC